MYIGQSGANLNSDEVRVLQAVYEASGCGSISVDFVEIHQEVNDVPMKTPKLRKNEVSRILNKLIEDGLVIEFSEGGEPYYALSDDGKRCNRLKI